MSFHDFPGNGQADPGAAFTGGAPDAGPAIRLEELGPFGFGNARPLILNRNYDATVLRPRAHFNCGPGCENLTALEIRLFSTCSIFPSSSDSLGSALSI